MARIKTALELAMERMQDIRVDEDKIRRRNLISRARTLAGSFLSDERLQPEDLGKSLSDFPPEQLEPAKQAINETVLMNLSLPAAAEFKARNQRLVLLLSTVNPDNTQAIALAGQICSLEEQYWEDQSSLLDNLKQQYRDALERSGTAPEQNKDFLKIYQQSSQQMNAQYAAALSRAKAQLSMLLGIDNTAGQA